MVAAEMPVFSGMAEQLTINLKPLTQKNFCSTRIMIPRIVLEPSLLWFLYVGPNKEFFCSGPLQSSLARPGVCVFIKLFIFPTPWLGPGPGQSSRLIVLQDWRLGENKNSNKTNINLISESPQAPGSVYQCLDFVH